ncbi:hypothetical protein CJD38_18175, partial [Stenotrophobium rhamnosiphilum]
MKCGPAKFYFSIAKTKDQGCDPCSTAQKGIVNTHKPINIGSGNENIQEVDYQSGDGRLKVSRSYNSSDNTRSQILSPGWRSNFSSRSIAPLESAVKYPPSLKLVSQTYTTPNDACALGSVEVFPGLSGTATYMGNFQCQMPSGEIFRIYSNGTLPLWNASSGYSHLAIRRPDGGQYEFNCLGTSCESPSDVPLKLTASATGYTLIDEHNTIEQYNVEGVLTSITYQDGYVQNLAYTNSQLTTVTDSFGRSLSFFYNAAFQLTKVITPDGNVLYGFDTQYGRLSTVTFPDTRLKAYQYANGLDNNLLTGIVDENNSLYATISYDAQGRAYQSGFAGNVLKS